MADRDSIESDSSESDVSDVDDCVVDISKTEEEDEQQLTLIDDNQTTLIIPDFEEEKCRDDFEEEVQGECDLEKVETTTNAVVKLETKLQKNEKQIESEKQKKKRKKKKLLYICLTNCKYESVRRSSRRYGFKEVDEDGDWNLYWTDFSVSLERVMDMKRYQKINHFPGMSELCRKDLLARNLNRMLKLFPKDYNIFPRSWCLPADHGDFLAYTRQKKNKTYILKPESGCQGRGIWLTKNPKDIKPHEHMLCQQYMSKPFLIDGFKFDLRVYALVTSCDPLRIFVFKDGLGRFATAKYVPPSHINVSNVYMHLTNYAINKNSNDFIRDEESGSKRRISTINSWLHENGFDVDKLWKEVDDVIIKTLISAYAVLKHNYRTCFPNHMLGSGCFEILGFDIVLDKKLHPFVLEVNHSPSFTTDAAIDREIKDVLLYDTLNIVNFAAADRKKCIEEDRRKIKERLLSRPDKKEVKEDIDRAQQKWLEEQTQYEETHMGNYRRIYPLEEGSTTEKYEKFFHSSGSLYQETAAHKARSECARQQREEINRKNEKMDLLLNKKKKDANLLRPESPGGRSRPRMKPRRMIGAKNDFIGSNADAGSNRSYLLGNIVLQDSTQPEDIVEREEIERVAGLVQRDNLIRGLGIIDHVYKLLQTIPNNILPPPPSLLSSKLENKQIGFTVDSASGLNDTNYHHPLTNQNYSYNALNTTATASSGQATIQSYLSQRNVLRPSPAAVAAAGGGGGAISVIHGTKSDSSQWRNIHRNSNTLAQPAIERTNRLRFVNRSSTNDQESNFINNDLSKVVGPSFKGQFGQTVQGYLSEMESNVNQRRNLGLNSFGLSLISGPAPFVFRPEQQISSANSGNTLRQQQQQQRHHHGSSSSDRLRVGHRQSVKNVRGSNSNGMLNVQQ